MVASAESFADSRTLAAGMGAPAEFLRTPYQDEFADGCAMIPAVESARRRIARPSAGFFRLPL